MDAIDDILLDNKFPLEFEEFFSEILSRPSKKIKIISTSRNPPRITMDQRAFYSYNIEGIDERAAIRYFLLYFYFYFLSFSFIIFYFF